MSTVAARRPEKGEYAEYFDRYIQWIDDANILAVLERQRGSIETLLGELSESQGNLRYEAGKWSIKELVGHIIDTERVFAYRALRFARNDATALAGFDQDAFAANANYANLPLHAIAAEFEAVRHSTLLLFRHISPEAWDRRGISNKNELSVRAAAFVIAGHAQHHMQILKSRYLEVCQIMKLAVVFDMDGLMLDTERLEWISCQKAGVEMGFPVPEQLYIDVVGRTGKDTARIFSEHFGESFSFESFRPCWKRHTEAYIEEFGVAIKPGLIEMLNLLEVAAFRKQWRRRQAAGPPAGGSKKPGSCSVFPLWLEVTRWRMESRLPIFTGRRACRLSMAPNRCIAFEDSEAGIRSACAAGMAAVLVPDMKPPSADVRGMACRVFESLLEAQAEFAGLLEGDDPISLLQGASSHK